ncbi:STAS domain-containing protein [Actinomadura scrupuli]|uniref:STAS domain-containing protein n=1 Tax=Actinomadura scrupuli TaxID=559629 RepID=UPI003D998B80
MSTHAHDWCTVVALAGELDLSTAPQLRRQILRSRTRGPHLVLDLAQLTFMDTTGLQVIMDAHTQALPTGATVAVAGPAGAPLRLLQITGLHHHLPVFTTLGEALSAARAAPQFH